MFLRFTSATAICFAITGCAMQQPNPVEAPLDGVLINIKKSLQAAQKESSATDLSLTEATVVLKVTSSSVDSIVVEAKDPLKITGGDAKFTNQTTGSLENTITLKWSGKDLRNTLGGATQGESK